ncbi:MAG: aspartate 1-decarboxylase [Candidatus Omnitrophica bacterium]|nr:aspartate 1-decarboxylase [Candidatus Omnitrophota bacterium]
MMIEFCFCKITYATITQAELHYEGSITIDGKILAKADIIPGQKVQIVNLNNGERFTTYAIAGKPGSGIICLNGPAARLGLVGDKIHILSYVFVDKQEAKSLKTKVIPLGPKNKMK